MTLLPSTSSKRVPLIVQTLICTKSKFMDTQQMHPDTLVELGIPTTRAGAEIGSTA
jgi:hypothetical protein